MDLFLLGLMYTFIHSFVPQLRAMSEMLVSTFHALLFIYFNTVFIILTLRVPLCMLQVQMI